MVDEHHFLRAGACAIGQFFIRNIRSRVAYINTAVLRRIHKTYERYGAPIAFLFGFIWDNLTLIRIDFWVDNLIIAVHLVLAGVWIAVLTLHDGKYLHGRLETLGHFAPLFLQFSFGALFSAFFVFYWRSASFTASWPFLIALLFLLIGNEFFQKRYQLLAFRMSMYFTALYSYSIFAVPVIYKEMGAAVFLASGLISLLLVGAAVFLLSYVIPSELHKSRKTLIVSIGTLYLVFHVLYFTNIIPPIPLSLKESGVYHSITRSRDGGYVLEAEMVPWYDFFIPQKIFHRTSGGVYVYSSIFAPAGLRTDIFHRWSYYDEKSGEWVETDRISFSITGGRDDGYRGYSTKSSIAPGVWRVDVETGRGQIVGRLTFTVLAGTDVPKLVTIVR